MNIDQLLSVSNNNISGKSTRSHSTGSSESCHLKPPASVVYGLRRISLSTTGSLESNGFGNGGVGAAGSAVVVAPRSELERLKCSAMPSSSPDVAAVTSGSPTSAIVVPAAVMPSSSVDVHFKSATSSGKGVQFLSSLQLLYAFLCCLEYCES